MAYVTSYTELENLITKLDFNHSLESDHAICYKIRIRLLSQVYHFNLLICYPYLLLFHPLMLVTLLR